MLTDGPSAGLVEQAKELGVKTLMMTGTRTGLSSLMGPTTLLVEAIFRGSVLATSGSAAGGGVVSNDLGLCELAKTAKGTPDAPINVN